MRSNTAGIRRGLSSFRNWAVLFGSFVLFGLVALLVVYAAATHDHELPTTFFRYVVAPFVSLLVVVAVRRRVTRAIPSPELATDERRGRDVGGKRTRRRC